VPAGQLVCDEEVLGGANEAVLGTIQNFNKDLGPLVNLAHAWNSTLGKFFGVAGKIASSVIGPLLERTPGYRQVVDAAGEAFQPIISTFTDYLIPSPFGQVRGSDKSATVAADQSSEYMSGGRVFDLMAGGADVSGNDYAHNGLGGKALTPEQTAAIVNEQAEQNYQEYQKRPLTAKLFDTSSEYSLVGRLALMLPAGSSGFTASVADLFTHPFAHVGGVLGFWLHPMSAFAATAPQSDPFGIVQYGYPAGDPTLAAANQDPEAYWNKNCSSDGDTIDWKKPVNSKWQNNGLENAEASDSGMPENTATNPCLLIQAAAGSAGGLYDSGLAQGEIQ
jgi:hypothetical protein